MSSNAAPEERNQSADGIPPWHFAAYGAVGATLHAVLFLAVPGRFRTFMFGLGTALIAGALVGFLFPETRTWGGRGKIPFTSRRRALSFTLIVVTAFAMTVVVSYGRIAGWWRR
jgi:ABC-type branched-subunit amino acid transport system permease subunit